MKRSPLKASRVAMKQGSKTLAPSRQPIKRVSDKRRADLKREAEVRANVLERDGRCILAERLEAHPDWPPHVCEGPLTYHHIEKAWKGSKGSNFTEVNGAAVCLEGNASWIERWPIEAKALGLVR